MSSCAVLAAVRDRFAVGGEAGDRRNLVERM
jgi:hypothetical protein